ncbi:MAG: DegV family protein, partial [bacterium]|nr:DegV family protein [bacterium]
LPQLSQSPISAKSVALAFAKGKERAKESIQNPKEGTILDVIDGASSAFQEGAEKEKDILTILKSAIERAKVSLLQTREKLEVLKKANVVDAGGLGFLMILESYSEALGSPSVKMEGGTDKPSEEIKQVIKIIPQRYELISLLENPGVSIPNLKEKLKSLGDSLDIVQVKNRMKIHFHTDFPGEVKKILEDSGRILEFKTGNLAEPTVDRETGSPASIGIVTEDLASLLPKIIERYQIELAPAILDWPDLKNIPGENIYQKMREIEKRGIKTFPKTSQATPKSFLDAFKKQLARFEKVLCLTVTAKISGCYNSAVQARSMLGPGEKERIFILDSTTVAAGQAVLILKAIELIQEGKGIKEVLEKLNSLIPQVYTYLAFEDPKWVESIGRITKSQASWIRRMKKIRLHPLMRFKEGLIVKSGIVWAKDTPEALFKKIADDSKRARNNNKKIRLVINQADNPQGAERLKELLKQKLEAEVSFVSEGPAIICAGLGPGSILAAWVPIE